MTLTRLTAALLVALLATGAMAQQKGKKLYRWVDKDGKVQFSDALPPEAVDQARREFDSGSGMSTGAVDRAPTAEELAAAAASAQAQASAAEIAAAQRLKEQAMLTSYTTEDDLKRSYDERVSLLQQTLESGEVSIVSQRQSLASLLSDAAEWELADRKLDAKRAQTIRDLHRELIKQQDMLVRREAELVALNQEYAETLALYRKLKSDADAPPASDTPAATPPAANAPAAAPQG